jgi:RHS repeat-associated protein
MKMKKQLKPLLLILLQATLLVQPTRAVDLYVPVVKNSEKTIVPLTGITNTSLLNDNNSLITIEYTDGLGQTNMTVQKGRTPSKKDLATVANFDCLGRLSNQWLPTPMVGITTADPAVVIQQAQTFYADAKPYTTITPLTNVIDGASVCKPGNAWYSGSKILKKELLTSNFTDTELFIRQYSVVDDNVKLTDDPNKFFSAAVLKTTDEDGKASYTFTDIWDRTLLKRTINNGINYDTYYIYDDIGHLRFVLSPEASDRMATAGTTYSLGTAINGNNDPLAQYAYVYKYDDKGRCVAKKLPGKDWNYLMYDMADHLIFSQDGNQHTTSQWTYYKYDGLDRLIQSGTTTITDAAGAQSAYNSTTMVETYVAGTGYTSSSTFNTWCTNTKILTQNFYDTYNFLNMPAYSAYKSTLTYTAAAGYSSKYSKLVDGVDIATQGMLTGTAVAMLDNSATIVSAMYYNDKGQVVESLTRNTLNGYTRDWYTYSFTGKVLRKFEMHATSFNISAINSVYNFKYDFADRLTDIWHKQNTRTDSVNLCSIQYDELGRPIKKILHGGIQTIDYGYNIHNQLKSINSPLFGETLHYEDGQGGKPSYFNGNIGSVTWGAGTTQDKQYDFTYDGLNRMTQAWYSPDAKYSEEIGGYDKNGNINLLARGGCYDNTPIGGGIEEGKLIDAIANTYAGNQLIASQDGTENQSLVLSKNDFKDDDNARTEEYLYDKNGNRIADANKGIALIKYNILNLPEKIYFMNGNKIEYMYDATGVKHKAKYTTALNSLQIPLGQSMENPLSNVLKKDSVEYFADYIYTNRVIDKVLTPEGYIQTGGIYNNWDNWKYRYSLTDHQGNTRVTLTSDCVKNHSTTVFTASGQIDYYPFGMEITPPTGTNSGTNPYLYSGKEIDRMHGLNEYDFSARWQDPAVPGFTTMDPLVEQTPWESPYSYCGANPVNRTDPTGLEWYTKDSKYYWFTGVSSRIHVDNYETYTWAGSTIYYENEGYSVFGDQNGTLSLTLPAVTTVAHRSDALNYSILYSAIDSQHTDSESGNSQDVFNTGANIVGAFEFATNLAIDAHPKASIGIKGTGTGLSGLTTGLTGYQVYNQYKKGGAKNINPVDATSVTLGTIGIATKFLSVIGFGGKAVSVVGEVAGFGGLAITVVQLWNNVYKPMNDLRYAPSYIDSDGQPIYGDPTKDEY